jgi:cytoplasmic iron level regulating protein YaaA (DUF328/UPF0246 family)
MIFLLSPAKTLDYDTPSPVKSGSKPPFLTQTAELIALLQRFSTAEIAALMSLSEPLAALNVGRYAAWRLRFTDHNSKPAVFAFNGDVYEGLDAPSLSADDLAWAQAHLAILSGLYGVLRPLDRMQPYRLEMGTRLAHPRGKDLYAFWGDTLAEHLNQWAAADASPVIVNLASQEYFKAADRPVLKPRVIDCVFEDWKDAAGGGAYKIISFYAKRARGLMARWAIVHRAATPEALQRFDTDGYAFAAGASSADRLVFRRRLVAAH